MKTKLITLIFCLFSISILNCAKRSEDEAIQKKNAIEKNSKAKTILNSVLQSYLPNDIHSIVGSYLNDNDTYKCIETFKSDQGPIFLIYELKDGRLILGSKQQLKIFDLKNNNKPILLRNINTHYSSNYYVSLNQLQNGMLEVRSNDSKEIWDLNTHQCISKKYQDNCSLNDDPRTACRLTNNKWTIVSVKNSNNINYCDDFDNFHYLEGHTSCVRVIYQLQNGNLISGSDDKTIKIWDLNTKICIATLSGHDSLVWALCQLQDGRLISSSYDGTLKIWANQFYELMQPSN